MSLLSPFQIHVKWKVCFIHHIRLRKKLSDELRTKIVHETECALGRWLESAETLPFRGAEAYARVCRQHASFHDEMRRLARLIDDEKFLEAESQLQPGSSYERGSTELSCSLVELKALAQVA